jgi:hypothetical protein
LRALRRRRLNESAASAVIIANAEPRGAPSNEQPPSLLALSLFEPPLPPPAPLPPDPGDALPVELTLELDAIELDAVVFADEAAQLVAHTDAHAVSQMQLLYALKESTLVGWALSQAWTHDGFEQMPTQFARRMQSLFIAHVFVAAAHAPSCAAEVHWEQS